MKYNLYLDDVRQPPEYGGPWTLITNLKEFKNIIIERGLPKHMSLDHDLGYNENGEEETGMKAIKWLIDQALDIRTIRTITLHSANPIGRENMSSLLNAYTRHLDRMDGDTI